MEELLILLRSLKEQHPDLEVIPDLTYNTSDFTTNQILLKTSDSLEYSTYCGLYLLLSGKDINIMELYNELDFCTHLQVSSFSYRDISEFKLFEYPENNLKLYLLCPSGNIFSQFYDNTLVYSHLQRLSCYLEPIDKQKAYTLPHFLCEDCIELDTIVSELGCVPVSFINSYFLSNHQHILGSVSYNSETQVFILNSDDYNFFLKRLDFLKRNNIVTFCSNRSYRFQEDTIESLEHFFEDISTIDKKYLSNLMSIETNLKVISSNQSAEVVPLIQGIRTCSYLDLTSRIETVYSKATKLHSKTYLELPSNTPVAIINTNESHYKIYSAACYSKIENIIITTPSVYDSVVAECKDHFDTVILSEDLNTVEGFLNVSSVPLDLVLVDIRANLDFYYYPTNTLQRTIEQLSNNIFLPIVNSFISRESHSNICNQYSINYSTISVRSRGFPFLADMFKQEYTEQYDEIQQALRG